jgi:protein Tex
VVFPVADLKRDEGLRERIVPTRHLDERVGMPTLTAIHAELGRSGRDPCERFAAYSFAEGIENIEDLVQVRQLANSLVKDPGQVIEVQQRVQVTVLAVDLPRRRISLSMR